MRMQVFADFFPVGELLDALPVDEVDFIDPRFAGKYPRKGGVYGPGDPGIGIGLAQGVEGGELIFMIRIFLYVFGMMDVLGSGSSRRILGVLADRNDKIYFYFITFQQLLR